MKYVLFALGLIVIASCSSDSVEPPQPPTGGDFTIWDGPQLTFIKNDRTDPREEANQDRITDNVWLTRGVQGSIYNIVSQFGSSTNPDGTEWAFGTTDDIATLTFQGFQDTHGRETPSIVGKDMVLHLIAEDVYIDIKFTKWGRKKTGDAGAFTYERSTQ